MGVSWFLMFPVLFVTRCLSANNDECLRSSKYENVGKGFALTGHVIFSLQVADVFDCSLACLEEFSCQSYNFQEDAPSPLHLCQLSNERRDTKPGDYQAQANMTYYDANKPQEGPGCSSSPCLYGGKCISTCHRVPFSFRCVCDEPRSGDLCQNWKDGYDLTFHTKSVSNYVNSAILSQNLKAFTLCMWFQTSQAGSFGLVAGLLTIVCHGTGMCDLYVTLDSKRTFYGAPLNDGMWHSLCVTWLSAGGHWSAYVDGKTNVRRSGDKFRNNKIVESDGQQLMLGQKIKKDGAFRESFSFTGNISRVNLWDYVMSEDQVHNVATACARPAGNVLKWRDFRDGLQEGVVLSERSQCIGVDSYVNVSLRFPSATIVDRVLYSDTLPSLQAFTVCQWIRITQMSPKFSTGLSYENGFDNALNIRFIPQLGVNVLINNNYRKVVSTPFYDKLWHHVCITWASDGGEMRAFIDGLVKRAETGYQSGAVIQGGGVLIFGHEQSSAGFDQEKSFVGLMTHVNMWNFVLPPFSLADMATGLGTEKGNLVAWGELLSSQMYGAVEVVPVAQDPPKRTMPDFKFVFPSQSAENYVELTSATSGPSLSQVTACVWVKVTQVAPMVLFSYKSSLINNALTIIATDTTLSIFVSGSRRDRSFNGFVSESGWQHVCFVWGNEGSWQLFVNGISEKSGSSYAVGQVIPAGGKILLGLRHATGDTFETDECFMGEISHLNIWNTKLDKDSRVIPAMYRGCDATGGNWLNWDALSQATVAGNVVMATPAECILPDEMAEELRNQFCEDETMAGCTAPVYALFDGEPSHRSKRWRCYFSDALILNSMGQLEYDYVKNSNCFKTITQDAFFDII